MKIINTFFCCFFLLMSTSGFAQKSTIDSLENQIRDHKEEDTLKVNLLNSIAFNYISYDIAKAEEKAIEANRLAKELAFKKGLARSWFVDSKIHISKSELDEALEDGLLALELYKEIKNLDGMASVYNLIGIMAIRKNDPEEALLYFHKALDIVKETSNQRMQSDFLKNIGNVAFSKGNMEEARGFYKKAIALSEKIGDKKGSLAAISNVAVLCTVQGRLTEALDYFNKALSIHRANNNKQGIADVTLNICATYWENKQPEKALVYLGESLALHRELNDRRGVAKCLSSMGAIYVDSEEYSKALPVFEESRMISRAIDDKSSLITCHSHIGGLYISLQQPQLALDNYKTCLELSQSLGNELKVCYSHINLVEAYYLLEDYSKALYHGLKGKKIADDLGVLHQQKVVTNALSKIYESTGEFKKSLAYHKLHKTLNDSLFNKENTEKITALEYEYKYKQQLDSASIRELELTQEVDAAAQNLVKSKRNLLLGVIAFLLTALALGAIIFFLKLRNAKSEAQKITIEQKLLRSQMTPHFVFNSLSVLQGMILNNENRKSITYLSRFSKLLRLTLENSRDKMVPLSQELITIENYLELQNLEVSQPYEYAILVEDSIDIARFEIPPMLIQPFVENAIEHGFKNQKENKKIQVQIKYSNKDLICTITDNGIGVERQKENEKQYKKSLATTITTERLRTLSKEFKTKGEVSIEDRQKYKEHGTIVKLVIPYKIQ